jgi:hypothetical protein
MILFLQSVAPPPDNTAYAWIAGVALALLVGVSVKYDLRQTERIKRSETLQDTLLADNKTQAATMRDLADSQDKLIDAVEKAVTGILALDAKNVDHDRFVREKFDRLERDNPTQERRRS